MKDIQLHLKGMCYFTGDTKNVFKGPIKKGFRPIIWYRDPRQATSCSFISNSILLEGESKLLEIVVLSESSLNVKLKKGMILSFGSVSSKIGEFKIDTVLGHWNGGKLP